MIIKLANRILKWLFLREQVFRADERDTLTFLDAAPKWSRDLTPLPTSMMPVIQKSPSIGVERMQLYQCQMKSFRVRLVKLDGGDIVEESI